MMKLYLTLSLLLLSLLSSPSQAVYYRDITDSGTSASSIALGGVQGFDTHATVLLDNPSALHHATNNVSAMFLSYFDGTQHMTAGVTYPLTSKWTVGVATAYERSADLDKTTTSTTNEAVALGTFVLDHIQTACGTDYALSENFHVGASWIHYIDRFDGLTSYGNDIAVGATLATPLATYTVSGKNLGRRDVVYSDGTSERLPVEWTWGVKSAPLSLFNTTVYGQLKSIDGTPKLLTSLGLHAFLDDEKTFGVSLGYRDKTTAGFIKGTFTAGLSLKLESLTLDYAYEATDVYQNAGQYYFSVKWGY
jgi:hypothetical protein